MHCNVQTMQTIGSGKVFFLFWKLTRTTYTFKEKNINIRE